LGCWPVLRHVATDVLDARPFGAGQLGPVKAKSCSICGYSNSKPSGHSRPGGRRLVRLDVLAYNPDRTNRRTWAGEKSR